jgi:hypothetical protein
LRGRLRRVAANLLMVAASLTVGLGLLELGFRMARSRSGGGKELGEEARYLRYDPLLGWSKTAGARVTYDRREYRVDVAINDKGLRDVPREYRPAPGVVRVLAVGDSFLEGYTVPLEQTVTQQLEAALGDRGCHAEVINGGTTAWSTDQELLFFRSEGVRYEPELVLLFFYYNDVYYTDSQSYFGRPKPIFQMTEEGLELHRYPVRRPRARISPDPPDPPDPDEAEANSALVQWVSDRLYAGAPGLYDALSALGLWEPMPRRAPRLELRVYDVRQVPRLEDAWGKTEAVLRAFRDDVEQSGARFLVVYVPSRMEIQDDSWRVTLALYGDPPFERGAVARRLEALGERNGFDVLDLTAPLRRADRGLLGRPYFQFDGHWTARGHAAAAGAIGEHLLGGGQLAGCN